MENTDPSFINSENAETVPHLSVEKVQHVFAGVKQELQKMIVGQTDIIDLLVVALLCEGHVLLEGVPGIAKTMTAKLLAKTIHAQFARLQFTPDLMPSDVMGTMVFNAQNANFSFHAGPIFSNIVLIDEINRAPAKTQSALFEAMEERQVTIDGNTYPMKKPFFVVATQNPIEQEGTYRLPEAQLDRFLFKINMEYPNFEEEKTILHRFKNDFNQSQADDVKTILNGTDISTCRNIIENVSIHDEILNYIAAIVYQTRHSSDLYLGASPRASLSIMKTAKAMAAYRGRDFVTPDDVQSVCVPVLNHRIILTPEREMEGLTTSEIVRDIIKGIDVPR